MGLLISRQVRHYKIFFRSIFPDALAPGQMRANRLLNARVVYTGPVFANEINKKLSVELFQLQFEMIAAVVSERIAQTVALRQERVMSAIFSP